MVYAAAIMSNDFITNEKIFLSDIINSILPKAQNVSFLVGYFYFSGFAEIYRGLKDKNLRVLVGLEIEQDILNRVREVNYLIPDDFPPKSREEQCAGFYDSLVRLFNDTDYFDTQRQQDAFALFLEKIQDGTLAIRKTKDPCHAKMYLFQNDEANNEGGSYPGALITGSSNLSFAGLRGRLELNAVLRGKSDFEEGKRIFDKLWETAVPLADVAKADKEESCWEKFERGVIEKIWYGKLYPPYCFFLRALDEYFSVYDNDIKTAHEINDDFYDLRYQNDAIKLALETIRIHNGVIISDVVGLGKSIIASVAAHNLGLRTIIVAPPHLVPQWEDYHADFNYNAKVFSSGKTGDALAHFNTKHKSGDTWLIIIDEAHKYRNEYTDNYNNLHKLCRGNKVMLLTATPFNNKPEDIYTMVKLFQLPLKSTLNLKQGKSLHACFHELIERDEELRKKQRNKEIDEETLGREVEKIGEAIRHIISPLIIRRSRLDLCNIEVYKKDLEKQNISLSETGDPELLEYPLDGLNDLYIDTLRRILPDVDEDDEAAPRYKAARYDAFSYVKEEHEDAVKRKIKAASDSDRDYNLVIGTQRNLAKFMRRLLVLRFESSKKAFEISLERMIAASRNILAWIDKRGKVPVFKRGALPDIEKYYQEDGTGDDLFAEEETDPLEKELDKLEAKGFFELEIAYFEDRFVEDIKSDIQILEGIQEQWFGKNSAASDPKREHFVHIIKEQIKKEPERKIVVFSFYADTVDDLFETLEKSDIRVFKYTSRNSNKRNKAIIKRNFDAGEKKQEQKNDYNVLVATDAISEGYNLHRAGTVFNYDIPYNPTRVIQRVGRINRINKKVFDRLYIYNYFPTGIGEDETRIKAISTLKMAMINAILGEDTKVLTKDIELRSFFAEQYKELVQKSETESWETRYRNILENAKGTEEYKTARAIPRRARVGRTAPKGRAGVLLFGRKQETCVFKIATDEDIEPLVLDHKEAFALFEADIDEQPQAVSERFDAVYQQVKKSLFKGNEGIEKIEKTKRAVLDKIDAIAKAGTVPDEYIRALRYAAEIDALSRSSIQYIQKCIPKDYNTLLKVIDRDFLERVRKMARDIDNSKASIILSEELQ